MIRLRVGKWLDVQFDGFSVLFGILFGVPILTLCIVGLIKAVQN